MYHFLIMQILINTCEKLNHYNKRKCQKDFAMFEYLYFIKVIQYYLLTKLFYYLNIKR